MFRFESSLARGPIGAAVKAAVPAIALVFGLASAPAGHAATYVLEHGSMDHARTLNISGIGNVSAGPIEFDGHIQETGELFNDFAMFCVDIYHRISLGDYNPDLTYTDTIPLTTDSNPYDPQPLSDDQILQIGRLVNYGENVFNNAPTNTFSQRTARWNELAVVQGAIWQVVSGRNVTSYNFSMNQRIDLLSGNQYLSAFNGAYGPVGSRITFVTPFTDSKEYPSKRLTQSFAFAAVPEPATWVMMIGGFAVAGAALRARRRRTLAA